MSRRRSVGDDLSDVGGRLIATLTDANAGQIGLLQKG